MEICPCLFVIRSASLVGLTLCPMLLRASLSPDARVCPLDFDCEKVLSSRFGTVAGVPLPLYGMFAFAAIFACSLSARPLWRRLLRGLASLAGGVGLTLIFVQIFLLHNMCPLCMVVDCCAFAAAVAAWRVPSGAAVPLVGRSRLLWIAASFAALVLGVAARWLPNEEAPSVPPQVSAHWIPGKVTLVEVVDFQCPHCRIMHSILTRFLREQGQDLHVVRIAAPMAKHPQARDAARAYLCGLAQNKAEEMSQALFDSDNLTPNGCERLAAQLGLSLASYRTCVASPQTEQAIDENVSWVMKACPKGLPCLWVQDRRFSGVPSSEELRAAVLAAELRLRASGL